MIVQRGDAKDAITITVDKESARHLQNALWRAFHDAMLPEESRPSIATLYKAIRAGTGRLSDQDQD